MTDHPFLVMLDAARALHDRDPNDPGRCLTCGPPDYRQEWRP